MNVLATYIPFVTPAPVWGFWWVLLFPLVAAVAVRLQDGQSPPHAPFCPSRRRSSS